MYIIYDIIYNIGELFLEISIKARQNMALTGVLEMRKGHVEQARAFFQVDLVVLLKFSILHIRHDICPKFYTTRFSG